MKKRQREVFEALKKLGGEATTQEIANYLGKVTKGINRTLKDIKNIQHLSDKGDQSKWKIKANN